MTIGAGGDNLAVYIPLFRTADAGGRAVTAFVFVVLEILLTLFILSAGRHPRSRALTTRIGALRRAGALLRHRRGGARRSEHLRRLRL